MRLKEKSSTTASKPSPKLSTPTSIVELARELSKFVKKYHL
jgi:hypothetical protein